MRTLVYYFQTWEVIDCWFWDKLYYIGIFVIQVVLQVVEMDSSVTRTSVSAQTWCVTMCHTVAMARMRSQTIFAQVGI